MKRSVLLFSIFLGISFFLQNNCRAQEPMRWTLLMTTGTACQSAFFSVKNDTTISIYCDGVLVDVALDSLAALTRQGERNVLKGIGYGFLGGAVFGAIIGAVSYQKPDRSRGGIVIDFGIEANIFGGAALGAVGGMLIGGTVEASRSTSRSFIFTGLTRAKQIQLLRTAAQ